MSFFDALISDGGDRLALIAAAINTPGIARNLASPLDTATPQGGGDLNGSQATSRLFGHAGTAADRPSVPRTTLAGNFTGVV